MLGNIRYVGSVTELLRVGTVFLGIVLTAACSITLKHTSILPHII